MHLERARIKNFRSLRDIEVEFGAHTALLGGNGTGKSSILKAIEKFYATSKTCDVDDYFGRDTSNPIEIELTFKDLTEHESAAFHDRVRDGRLVVTRVFDGSPSSGRYHGVTRQNPDFAIIRSHSTANPKREAYRHLRETNPAYANLPAAASAAAVDQALLDWEANHSDELQLMRDDGQFFGFQNNSRGKLQRHTSFILVPAVREASADAADGRTSVIGRLLELLVRSQILQRSDFQEFKQQVTDRYHKLVSPENMPELQALERALTDGLQSLYADSGVTFNWRDVGDLPVPLPTADVLLTHDGFGAPVDRQGHGLQRAFIFTLLQHLSRTSVPEPDANEPPDSPEHGPRSQPQAPTLILAIEEPELYQHPTKQRHFAEVLRRLSSGALPGVPGHTQIIFASHSPMFVSMGKPEEVRLIRRIRCEETDYKQCAVRALDLDAVARKLGAAWGKEPGTYTANTLAPRLHILGTELAEGFFANGVVLVEGRSDKAALSAVGRLMDIDFEAQGIAIISADGKGNLDKPLVIFRELGIPTFVLWDCDTHMSVKDQKSENNLALLKLANSEAEISTPPQSDCVGQCFAHFAQTLERKIKDELTAEVHEACLAEVCEQFGLTPSSDAHKIPEVMFQTLRIAHDRGRETAMLKRIVEAICSFFQ
jgi:predicted ATPase